MTEKRFVYLAGPILHCTDGQANDWRREVAALLEPHNITGISPLRCEPLVGDTYELTYADERFGSARAIRSKNFHDVRHCDLTLAYLPLVGGVSHRVSIGTVSEISWAFALGKPAILVSDDPIVNEHPVIDAQVGWKLKTLDEAVDVCIGILAGYVGGKNV